MTHIVESEVYIPENRQSWSDTKFASRILYELIITGQAKDIRAALTKPIVTMIQWTRSRGLFLPDDLSGLRYGWGEEHLQEMIILTSGKVCEAYRSMYNPAVAVSLAHMSLKYMVDYGDSRGWSLEPDIKQKLRET